jgi:hypothetical protein
MIILTRAAGVQKKSYNPGDSSAYSLQTQIVSIDPQKPESSLQVLSKEFYSAKSPAISYDGNFMLFSGKLKQNDAWQIWEMNLENLKARQLTDSKENFTDPAYLPVGRFIYTRHSAVDSLKADEAIFTCKLDGTDRKRITYDPFRYHGSNVLNDGRIITITRQKFPEDGNAKLMVMRPDGTKSELFYRASEGNELSGPGFETTSGRVVFIESEKSNQDKGSLISISYNRPMHSRVNLSSGIEGEFRAVCPQSSGKLLVSFRKTTTDRYALYEFDSENKSLGKIIYKSSDFDVLEVVKATSHPRPRKMPSEVNPVIKTGLIMCQDINLYDNPLNSSSSALAKVSRIEIMGTDSSLGVFKPMKDGSFYLKVVADKPFRIRSLDEDGKVVRECDWIWLRPNERRGCAGCHEDQDIVPDNRISLAVKKAPIGIPVHVNKIIDEMIDTE